MIYPSIFKTQAYIFNPMLVFDLESNKRTSTLFCFEKTTAILFLFDPTVIVCTEQIWPDL